MPYSPPKPITPEEGRMIRQFAHSTANAVAGHLCYQRYGECYNTNYNDSVRLLVYKELAEHFRLRAAREIGPT